MESKVALVVTGSYCELLTCIVVMPVVGGVKGTKVRLSLEVPPLIFNVYQRRRFVCFVCVRWGVKGNLKLLRLSLNVPPPIRLRVSTSYFRGGENECKSTLFVTGTSSNLLTCIKVFFLFYIYIVR